MILIQSPKGYQNSHLFSHRRLSELGSRWLGFGSLRDDATSPISLNYVLTIEGSSETMILLISSFYFNFKIYFNHIFPVLKDFKLIDFVHTHLL